MGVKLEIVVLFCKSCQLMGQWAVLRIFGKQTISFACKVGGNLRFKHL